MGSLIELVQGPAVASLRDRGVHVYHVGYLTECLEQMVDRFTQSGAAVLVGRKPAILFGHRPVIFLDTEYGVIELIESPSLEAIELAGAHRPLPFDGKDVI